MASTSPALRKTSSESTVDPGSSRSEAAYVNALNDVRSRLENDSYQNSSVEWIFYGENSDAVAIAE
jgi:hypothetical protein